MNESGENSPLRLGIWGYGRMGRAIADIARVAGDEIVWVADRSASGSPDRGQLQAVDVVVEFTRPEAAPDHVRQCLEAGVPVVCGTTGWQGRLEEMRALARSGQGALLWASNFSIGVHLFQAMLAHAGRVMQRHPAYRAMIRETHHVHKKDAPSGTAITLAETLIGVSGGRFTDWALAGETALGETVLPIRAIREDEVPGTHEILWESPIDTIALKHTAHNREGFARGAWQAARWIRGRRGLYTMQDVLQIPHADGRE